MPRPKEFKSGTTQSHLRQRRASGATKTRLKIWGRRLALAALLAGGGFWLACSGLPARAASGAQQKIYRITARHGFAVRNILVQGRVNTDPDVLRGLVNAAPGDPLLALNPRDVRESIERVSWIAQAHVERRLPDTVYIKLTERAPLALWQNKGKLRLIDKDGVILTDAGLQKFSALPLVVGEEAPAHAAALLSLVAAESSLMPRLEAATWIGNRRWNLTLKGGVTVELPADDTGLALHRLGTAQQAEELLDKNISAVDLREPGRITVQTKPGAVGEYKASLVSQKNI